MLDVLLCRTIRNAPRAIELVRKRTAECYDPQSSVSRTHFEISIDPSTKVLGYSHLVRSTDETNSAFLGKSPTLKLLTACQALIKIRARKKVFP